MPALRKCGWGALVVLLLMWPLPAAAWGGSMVLVARPELQHPLYARTVLVVAPFAEQQHYGFIINRPTAFRLAQMFPQHAPSREVASPVFLGGPVYVGLVFALFHGDANPGSGCLRMMPGLHAAFVGRAVDQIIESKPDAARFVTGLVVWRPGELAREIAGRMWYVLEPDASLLQRDPRALWEELVVRAAPNGSAAPNSAPASRASGSRSLAQGVLGGPRDVELEAAQASVRVLVESGEVLR